MISGDSVVLSCNSAAFATKNAGDSIPVSTNISIYGRDVGNYKLVQSTGVKGTIIKKQITIFNIVAVSKVYDGTAAATLTGGLLNGLVDNDVSLSDGTGLFSDKDVGTDKPVNASGFTLTGANAGNYAVVQPTGLTGSITPATLNLIVSDTCKFEAQPDPVFKVRYVGLLPGDDSSVVTNLKISRDEGERAGRYQVYVSGKAANYNVHVSYGYLTIYKSSTGVLMITKKSKEETPFQAGIVIKSNPVSLSSNAANFTVTTTRPSTVQITIYDEVGNIQYEKLLATSLKTVDFTWNLRNQHGRLVSIGTCLIVALVKDRNSGSTTILKAKLGLRKITKM